VRIRALPLGAVLLMIGAASAACQRRSAAEFLALGDRDLAAHKYAEAIIEYRSAIQLNPRLALAHAHLADAYVQAPEAPQAGNAVREYVRAADLLPDDVDAQLKAGEFLLLAHEYEDAGARADRVIARDPKNAKAHILKGNALAGLKNIDRALEEIDVAIKVDPEEIQAYDALGSLQLNRGRLSEAEAAFRRAIEVQPSSEVAQLALANFYWAAGRLADAEAPLKRAVAIEPRSVLAQRALAMFYVAAGRIAEAEAPMRAVAEQQKDLTSRLQLADYYMMAKRGDEGATLLNAIAGEKDGFAPATLRLAEYDRVQHRVDEADARIETVLARDRRNTAAQLLKARFLLADGRLNDALAIAEVAAASADRVEAKYLVGIARIRKGDIDGAIAAFLEVTKLNPRVVSATVQLAQLNLQKRAIPAALDFAESAHRAAPNSIAATLVLAQAYEASGSPGTARRLLTELAAAHPDAAAVHLQAAGLAMKQKDLAAARREFTRALDLAPSSTEPLRGLISVDLAEGRRAHARTLVDERLQRAPRDSNLMVVAADVYAITGDRERQEALLRSAIDADANNLDAFTKLAAIYVQQHRLDDARAAYERVGREGPSSVAASTMVAMILEVQNNPVEAQRVYESIVATHPEAALAANNLAWLYAERGGNLEVALELVRTAKRLLPDRPEIDDTLGWIYFKKNLTNMAIPPLQASVQHSPTNPLFLLHLGLAYKKNKEWDNARATLGAALRQKADFPEARTALDELR
jgi:tetratricopeptide (TPR) repeat protein